jgi:2-succinyl-6-hydroxy-2,4-cyclohexadiene-1-carboxylate synthase
MMARIAVNGVHLNIETVGAGTPLLLLHGFTGSAATWAPAMTHFAPRFCVVAPDLLGHGRSDAPIHPSRYRVGQSTADILAVLDHLGLRTVSVLGYSMGGRLALRLASTAPDRIAALVLVSASPGLRDPAARRARAAQDGRLADAIERDGVPAFVERWERLPIFATQAGLPEAARERVRAERLRHSARGLANSLRAMGQGVQRPMHDRLPFLRMPALILTGELDAPYCDLGREMQRLIPQARLAVVPGAGHAVHLEQPEMFCRLVLEFLSRATADQTVR